MKVYVVVHIYGGVLEEVGVYTESHKAYQRLDMMIPEPCSCKEGACEAYQDASLMEVELDSNAPSAHIESLHTSCKRRTTRR